MSASFQTVDDGVEHQIDMPEVAGPDGLVSELDQRIALGDRPPEPWRSKAIEPHGIEYRRVQPDDLLAPVPRPASDSAIWLRAIAPLPDDPMVHRALLAYASDHGLLRAAMLPHGLSFMTGQVRAREPRSRDVVPPRFPPRRLAALRARFAERERRARPVPRQHSTRATADPVGLDGAGRHAAHPGAEEVAAQGASQAPLLKANGGSCATAAARALVEHALVVVAQQDARVVHVLAHELLGARRVAVDHGLHDAVVVVANAGSRHGRAMASMMRSEAKGTACACAPKRTTHGLRAPCISVLCSVTFICW